MISDSHVSIRWQAEIRQNLLIAAAVTADLVISVGLGQSKLDRVGFLHAWERDIGILRWTYSGDLGMGLMGGILGTPVVEGNNMCFAGGRGALICIDVNSGRIKWEKKTDSPVVSAPLIVNDQVYFASEGGNLIALGLATGQERWVYQTAGAIRATPALSGNHLLVGSWDSHLYAVSIGGELVWKSDLSPARPTAIGIGDGYLVLFDSATDELRAITMTKDDGRWRVEEAWRQSTGHQTGIRPVHAPGVVCWADKDQDLVTCLDVTNGRLEWTTSTGRAPLTPVISGSSLIVASRDGLIAAFDLKTGDERWRAETGIQLSSEVALDDGELYIGGSDEVLYGLAVEPEQ